MILQQCSSLMSCSCGPRLLKKLEISPKSWNGVPGIDRCYLSVLWSMNFTVNPSVSPFFPLVGGS